MYTIDKNIPQPPTTSDHGHKSELRRLLESMDVGDSAFVRETYKRVCARIAAMKAAGLKQRFTTRQEADGRRVWRIA